MRGRRALVRLRRPTRSRGLALVFVLGLAPACSALFSDDLSTNHAAAGSCGNGVLDADGGEECESALPLTQSCSDLLKRPATGNVRCASCRLDLRSCVPTGQGGAGGMAGQGGGGASSGSGGTSGTSGAGGLAGAGNGGAAGAGGSGAGGAGAGGAGEAGTGAGAGAGAGAGGVGAGGGGEAGSAGAAGVGGFGATSGAAGAGATAGGSSSAGTGGVAGAGAGAGGAAGSGGDLCPQSCGPFLTCVQGACVCGPGSMAVGAGCWPLKPAAASTHTIEQVCAARAMGRQELHAGELEKSVGACGPWVAKAARLGDIANRINYFRWLTGMSPVAPQLVGGTGSVPHAACAAAVAYNSMPTASSTCATAEALDAASRSFRFPQIPGADTIDTYMGATFANGTNDTYRLQLLRQHVKPFFWGEFAGGGTVGGGSCLEIPSEVAPTEIGRAVWPPPGPVPIELAPARWTIAPLIPGTQPTITVTDTSTGSLKSNQVHFIDEPTPNNPHAVLVRQGWSPTKGRTYDVRVEQGGDVVLAYSFTPIECP